MKSQGDTIFLSTYEKNIYLKISYKKCSFQKGISNKAVLRNAKAERIHQLLSHSFQKLMKVVKKKNNSWDHGFSLMNDNIN